MIVNEMNEKQWQPCIVGNPILNGDYYIYISNTQIGDEIRKVKYENGNWKCSLEKNEKIIAWYEVEKNNIKNKNLWLKTHEKDICKAFNLSTVNLNEFTVAESIWECISEYQYWFHLDCIHIIDGKYVIKVLY